MCKTGPMQQTLHLSTDLSKKELIEEFNQAETKRQRSIGSLRREVEVPAIADEELALAVGKLKKENASLKKELRRTASTMNELAKLTFDELIIRINGNAFTSRMSQICRSVKDKVTTGVFFLNDGKLMTMTMSDDKPAVVVDNPCWTHEYDILRNKQPVAFGAASTYHEDNNGRDRNNPYPRGRGGLRNNSNYRGKWRAQRDNIH